MDESPIRRPRMDALPENTRYRDTGCEPVSLVPALPPATLSLRGASGAPAMLRTGRDATIVRLSREQGLSVDELAARFGLSRRTIFRVLRAARQPEELQATG